MELKNVKVDYETWRDLAKQKIENNLKKIAEVIKNNNAIAKKFNNEEQFTNWFIKKTSPSASTKSSNTEKISSQNS